MAKDITCIIKVDQTSGAARPDADLPAVVAGDQVTFKPDPDYSGDIVIVCPNDSPFVDLYAWEYVSLPSRKLTFKPIQNDYQIDCGYWNKNISAGPKPGTTRGPDRAFIRWSGGVGTPH